jgi:hypothetical protein
MFQVNEGPIAQILGVDRGAVNRYVRSLKARQAQGPTGSKAAYATNSMQGDETSGGSYRKMQCRGL